MKILGIVGIIGSAIIMIAGAYMTQIVSQSAAAGGEQSIAEVFYHAMGWGFVGLGIFCMMLISVVAWRK
jgi:hypothetical protein